MSDIAKLLDSIATLFWPVLAAGLILVLWPSLRKLLESRGFTVKVGGMEITVQQASDQLRTQVEDLQKQVLQLRDFVGREPRAASAAPHEDIVPPSTAAARPKRVLWVDDQPENNAYEIARLKDEGVNIEQVRSTSAAMAAVGRQPDDYAVIISDMSRREGIRIRSKAGLSLIKRLRESEIATPVIIYCGTSQANALRGDVQALQNASITASPVELFALLKAAGVPDPAS